jgi:hypothetical protein
MHSLHFCNPCSSFIPALLLISYILTGGYTYISYNWILA